MAALRIHLPGPFQVFREGQPLTASEWRSQQTRTIFKMLLARRGHVVPTDQLLEILWPNEDPCTARRRLHVRISQLRRLLDPDDPSAYVLTVEGGYAFNPEADCWLDTVEFEARAEWGRRCQEGGNLAEAITAYETARALYRGDFLEEDLYEDWTFAERERLRERFLTVLTELAECYAQQGRYRRAIARCRDVLAADPYRESIYVRLMLYHYYAGEQDRALRAYDRCRHVLADELGVEPLPQTVALYKQIRDGTLWAVEGAPRYPPPVYEGRLFAVPYSLGHTPFVGREREYAWLIEQWRGTKAGIILIEGEAGVGKSRLVEEFLGYVAGEGAMVLRSQAATAEGLPYAAITAALRPLLDGEGGEDLPPTTLAALAPLFPQVRDRRPDLPPLPELLAQQERERLLEAVVALARAAIPARAVLYIDDAHRADVASLDVVVRLANLLTVVLTCRSEETPPNHPLRIALRPLRRQRRLADLTLGRLPPPAVRTLIRRLARNDLPALVDQVIAQTDGNPLFVVTSLQHIFEEGALYVGTEGRWAVASGIALSLSPTMRETIEARLRRLSGDLRQVFDLVAVVGGEFDFALLQQATQMEEDLLLDALDGLLEAGLLVEPRTADRAEFAPAHDRYAEVAYDTLPQVRRRRLHRRVAEALEATAPDLDVAAPALAYHFEQAGDTPQAFNWLVRAGDAAYARYAHDEALALYWRAVALGSGETAPVWEQMGHIAHHLARYADGVHFYEMALARWQALGEAARQIHIHYQLAECHRELSQYDQAADHARIGLEMVTALPDQPALTARGHIVLANAMRSGQLAPVEVFREHLKRALELAQQAQEWQLVGEATFWLGVVAVNCGDAGASGVRDPALHPGLAYVHPAEGDAGPGPQSGSPFHRSGALGDAGGGPHCLRSGLAGDALHVPAPFPGLRTERGGDRDGAGGTARAGPGEPNRGGPVHGHAPPARTVRGPAAGDLVRGHERGGAGRIGRHQRHAPGAPAWRSYPPPGATGDRQERQAGAGDGLRGQRGAGRGAARTGAAGPAMGGDALGDASDHLPHLWRGSHAGEQVLHPVRHAVGKASQSGEGAAMVGRVLSLLSIPMMGLTLWGLIRQVRKEQRFKLSTPMVGLVMAPVTLLINVLFLHRALSTCLGPALLILGLGFGLAWGQTTRLYPKGGALIGKRSALHLLFWGISYAITQTLASFAPAAWVAGGLAAMFFSTGSTLGTNLNLLVRQLRMRSSLAANAAPLPPSTLPER